MGEASRQDEVKQELKRTMVPREDELFWSVVALLLYEVKRKMNQGLVHKRCYM